MSSERATRAERDVLRLLADLGGRAEYSEMEGRDDFPSPSHLTNLREKGLVALRGTRPQNRYWELTDAGREVVLDHAAEWAAARERLEATTDSEEAKA